MAEQVLISWRTLEHKHETRGNDWLWALGVVTVCSALTALLFSDFLFAVLILVAGVTLGIMAVRPAREVTFSLSERGITIDNAHYTYDAIDAFWIDESVTPALLLLNTNHSMTAHLVIPIDDQDPEHIRALLSEHVDETEITEPFSHKILEFFGF